MGLTVLLWLVADLPRSLTTFGFPDFPRFQVRGLFQMDPTYDESHVFIDLTEAQRLFRMNGKVTGFETNDQTI